jgi:methionyl-tRNA synthetase
MFKHACIPPCNTTTKRQCTEPRMNDLSTITARRLHEQQWSRIEPGFGISVDDNNADEFYVSVSTQAGYRTIEEKLHYFKMSDWVVHTNYPRDPLDFEYF